MDRGSRGVLIYGPQGCGKSIMAPLIAMHLGLDTVVEFWPLNKPVPAGVLAMTSDRQMLNQGAIDYFEVLQAFVQSSDVQGVRVVEYSVSSFAE